MAGRGRSGLLEELAAGVQRGGGELAGRGSHGGGAALGMAEASGLKSGEDDVAQRLPALGCVACHQRGGERLGGIEDPRPRGLAIMPLLDRHARILAERHKAVRASGGACAGLTGYSRADVSIATGAGASRASLAATGAPDGAASERGSTGA
jgi:hypothetical protein